MARWWREWTGQAPSSNLRCVGDDEIERLARDVGLAPYELRQLISLGEEGADLLLKRMAVLDLDKDEVSRTERRTFQDMQRVCTMCESRRFCTRELANNPDSSEWKDYCLNAASLIALSTLPWASRREW